MCASRWLAWAYERDAARLMLKQKQDGRSRRITVGKDKAYDTKDCVPTVWELNVTLPVKKNDKGRRQAIDTREAIRDPIYTHDVVED